MDILGQTLKTSGISAHEKQQNCGKTLRIR